jgi:hypothetical protein
MRFIRLIAAVVSIGFVVAALAQFPPGNHWPKYGVDIANTHKTANKGPAKPALQVIYVSGSGASYGATDEAIYSADYGFVAPFGPSTSYYTPDGFFGTIIATPPGNMSPSAVYMLQVYCRDGGDDPGDTVKPGRFVNRDRSTDPWGVVGPFIAYPWYGYGTLYIQDLLASTAGSLYNCPGPIAEGDIVLQTPVEFFNPWRNSAPVLTSSMTLAEETGQTSVAISSLTILTSNGDVATYYVQDVYTGHCGSTSMSHTFSLRQVVGYSTYLPINTMTPPAVSTDGKIIYFGTHDGQIISFTLATQKMTTQAANGSIDGPVVYTKGGNLMFGTSVNPANGRGRNAMHLADKLGKLPLRSHLMEGAVVGGPAYNSTSDVCYTTVLTTDSTGSNVTKLVKLAVNESNQTDPFTVSASVKSGSEAGDVIGLFTASPIIDGDGNVYIGTHNGWLYSFDANLTVRANYPVYVGGIIISPVTIDDNGFLFVASNTTAAIYKQGTTPQLGGKGLGVAPPVRK